VKRRRLFIFTLGVLAAVILGFTLWPREREPDYHGVPLTTWLARFNGPDGQEAARAVEFIRQNATTALPFLVHWLQHETPGWKKLVQGAVSKLPPTFQNSRCGQFLLEDRAEVRANAATMGLQILGPRVQPALPELQRLADNSKMPQTQRRALYCIINVTQRFPGFDDNPFR
jgi:hypothetical protein